MFKTVAVKALPGYKLWLKYDNGEEGEIDFSYLAEKGVFKIWKDPKVFATVSITPSGAIKWNDDVELCPDALYLKLTGKKPEEIFLNLKKSSLHA